MIKNDKNSLEELSFHFDEKEIATFAKLLNYFEIYINNSTLSKQEISNDIETLKKISKLKLDKTFYAFHVDDSWACEESGQGEGVSLYVRQGDKLNSLYSHNGGTSVPTLDNVLDHMLENKISQIYTGSIPNQTFLGIKDYSIDEADGHMISHKVLEDYEIKYLISNKIDVIKLDYLL